MRREREITSFVVHSDKHQIPTRFTLQAPPRILFQQRKMPHPELVEGKRPAEWWNKYWEQVTTPNLLWDAGDVSPPLVSFVEKHRADLPSGRVLVPGCGRGYAPVFFERVGLATSLSLGVDVADIGIAKAREYAAEQIPDPKITRFAKQDFFEMKEDDGKFEIIYDLTFLCAIDPSQRDAWAAQMKKLLAEDGQLITLLFPGSASEESIAVQKFGDRGPPFVLDLQQVQGLLEQHGFQLVGKIEGPCENSIDRRRGMEFIARWRHQSSSKEE